MSNFQIAKRMSESHQLWLSEEGVSISILLLILISIFDIGILYLKISH